MPNVIDGTKDSKVSACGHAFIKAARPATNQQEEHMARGDEKTLDNIHNKAGLYNLDIRLSYNASRELSILSFHRPVLNC